MMRCSYLVLLSLASLALVNAGCGDPEAEGRAAAKQRAAIETKRDYAIASAKKIHPPVPGRQKLPCTQVINTEAFQAALGEAEPMTVKENTASDFEATAVCGLIRGGERPDQKQQAEIMKKNAGRLGTLPGDELCGISLYCWTIEEGPRFLERCKSQGFREEGVMGTPACLQVVAQGADDVWVFKFFDEDTKCLIKARGGPSLVDNEVITTCARTARDSIGPAQIAVGGVAPPPPPADPSAPSSDSTY